MKKTFLLSVLAVFFAGAIMTGYAQKAPKETKVKTCNICHKEGKDAFAEYKTFLQDTHKGAADNLATDKAKEIAEANEVEDCAADETCTTCHQNNIPAEDFNPKDIDCETCHDSKSEVHDIPKKVEHPSGE